MIVVNSLAEAMAKINQITDLSNLDYTKALNKAAIVVENAAKENCAVDTGELRSSITHEVRGDEAVIYTNTDYAPYVEYGTGLFAENGDGRQDAWRYQDAEGNWYTTLGAPPQPFLRPALQDNRDKVVSMIKDEIIKEIERNAK